MELQGIIKQYKTIAFAKFAKEEMLMPTLGAMCSGGLPLVCIFPTAALTQKGLTLAVNTFPDTVIGIYAASDAQAELACRCGVSFVCSPFFSVSMLDICRENDMKYIPGALTPTEIQSALSLGLRTVMLSPSCMLPKDTGLAGYLSLFPGVNFLVDCSDTPGRAEKTASLSGVCGVIDPDIISPELDLTVARCVEAVGRSGGK